MLRRHGLTPKKGLGQNFLSDPQVARAIVAACALAPDDPVVEIGPGLGSLTLPLLGVVRRLVVIERDEGLIPALVEAVREADSGGEGSLRVIAGDALRLDYGELAAELGGPLRLVGNLPYVISTPLLFTLIDQRQAIHSMIFMFQREVAERLLAVPGSKDYGVLTVMSRAWMDIARVREVTAGCFFPQPKIVSTVLRLTMRSEPVVPIPDPARFQAVVRAAFGQRRKMLGNALKELGEGSSEWIERKGIDPRRRGETLTLEEFSRLALRD
ncbi:MAG: 16S rRNA (adenine(1518)-N(6)/adenine(1519)-N(6))-dimethyltransferase RsmA [Magnetococcales bacterium]|nr:16S rRNA (adenine(1518)-N(6)/adenine(1519)-N(6))-dimethyltransferase RsmA [Magnetococcales bacterium]